MGGGRSAQRFLLLAAAGLLLVIAGCLGGSDTEDVEPLNETDIADASATPDGDSAVSEGQQLAFEGPTAVRKINETGTFTTGDGAFAGGAFRGADTREHDLTPEVPTGLPVTLNVTIQYSGEASQLNGEWSFEGVEVFDTHYVKNLDTDTIWMEASLARAGTGGSVLAIVQADSSGESPEQEYSLDATITPHQDTILPGVATSVPVADTSGGFVVDGENGSLPGVAVWGPDGSHERLDASSGPVEIASEAEDPTGRYVVMVALPEEAEGLAATPLTVRAVNASSAPSTPLEVVPSQIREGSWNALGSGETVEWSFEQDRAPIQAGMRARPTQPMGSTVPGTLDVQLASPADTLIDASTAGIYGGASQIAWFTDLGDAALVAGSYEASASLGEGGTSWEVSHVVRELQLR